MLQGGSGIMASVALMRPLSPELAEAGVEVRPKIRSGKPGETRWSSSDEVVLTTHAVLIMLRDFRSCWVETIPLSETGSVETGRCSTDSGSWYVLPNGRSYSTPSGPLVTFTHCSRARLLPLFDAQEFAEILRIRVATRTLTASQIVRPD
jgi:hypothetical protein